MNVRIANKFDVDQVLELIKSFSQEIDVPIELTNDVDWDYINKMFHHIVLGAGIALVAEDNKNLIGVFLGLKTNNLWQPKQYELHELLFYVQPKYRKSRIAYKLLTKYNELAKMLYEDKKVSRIVMTKTEKLGNINYERFGYKKVEESWAIGV
jgi:GNAT superfamily N-acetyltransferase